MKLLSQLERFKEKRKSGGFTLVEVVVALGITVTGMLPLLALLILAMEESNDSKEESLAAHISDGIYSNLRHSAGWLGGTGGILIQTSSNYLEATKNPGTGSGSGLGPDPDDDFDFHSFDSLGTSAEFYISYGYDSSAAQDSGLAGVRPIKALSAAEYAQGFFSDDNTMTASHMVKVSLEESTLNNGNGLYEPVLFLVEVSVEWPSVAKEEDRNSYVFSTHLNLTDEYSAPSSGSP